MPDAGFTMTDVLSVVSIGGTLLVAGRVVFSTEAAVKALENNGSKHDTQLNALIMSAGETKASHAALVERVNSLNIAMENKASIESVAAVREAVESLRREQEVANRSVIQHLERIENKIEKR